MGTFWRALAYSLMGNGPTVKKVKEAQMLAAIQEQNELLKKLEKRCK